MSMLGAIRRAGSLLAAALALVRGASAQQEASEPNVYTFRLDYEAAPGCPPGTAFATDILERSERIVFDPTSETALVVVVERDADRYRGSVRQREAGLEREVEAKSCDDAVFGLTMITLIAFDPDARLGAQGDATPIPIPETSEGTVPPSKAPNATPSPPPPPLAPRESRLTDTALWRLGVAPRAQFGDVGTLGWGVQLEATRTDAARRGAWLMGLDVVTSEVGLLDSSARLVQVGAFGAICPSLVEGGTLFGCGGMEVAALAADTSDSATVEAEPASIRALVAPTAMLGFQTEVAPGWFFFARGGAAYHLITYDFGVARAGDTTTSAFEQSRVAGRASVGVAHDL